MALITCLVHKITYNDKLDPACPQCAIQGIVAPEGTQAPAKPGKFGAPAEEL
jgi:hypothetical protein